MERNGIKWEQLGTHKEHLSVLNYKKEERAKEVEKLNKEIAVVQKKKLEIDAIDKVEVKSVPLSSKVMLSPEDYKTLSTAAKKYAAQVKKESKLEKLLKAAENVIEELKAQVKSLTQELNKDRSVREQLDVGTLRMENKVLQERNNTYRKITIGFSLYVDVSDSNSVTINISSQGIESAKDLENHIAEHKIFKDKVDKRMNDLKSNTEENLNDLELKINESFKENTDEQKN